MSERETLAAELRRRAAESGCKCGRDPELDLMCRPCLMERAAVLLASPPPSQNAAGSEGATGGQPMPRDRRISSDDVLAAMEVVGSTMADLSVEALDALSIRTGCETEANRRADTELKRRGYVFDPSNQRWALASASAGDGRRWS